MITEHVDMASWMAYETNGLVYQCLLCFPLASMITGHADMASWMAFETNGLAYQCLLYFPLADCQLGILSET